MITNYTRGFSDLAKAKEMAYAMIKNDVDEASLGVIETAKEKEIKIIGSTGDVGLEPLETVVTSIVENFPKGISEMIKDINKGGFEVKTYEMGFKNNAMELAPLRAYKDESIAENKQKINEIIDKIKKGEINLEKLTNE